MARCALSMWPATCSSKRVRTKRVIKIPEGPFGISHCLPWQISAGRPQLERLPRAISQPTMHFARLFASKLVKMPSMGLDHLAVSLELLLGRLWLRD
jgi:hypothetical protein